MNRYVGISADQVKVVQHQSTLLKMEEKVSDMLSKTLEGNYLTNVVLTHKASVLNLTGLFSRLVILKTFKTVGSIISLLFCVAAVPAACLCLNM